MGIIEKILKEDHGIENPIMQGYKMPAKGRIYENLERNLRFIKKNPLPSEGLLNKSRIMRVILILMLTILVSSCYRTGVCYVCDEQQSERVACIYYKVYAVDKLSKL